MRSETLDLDRYNTDKINNRYLDEYDPILEPLVDKNIKLLELGVYKGGSVLLWRDYFPMGTIVGIDVKIPKGFDKEERIHLFKGSQTDKRFLTDVAGRMAPDGFDIIIDDASHIGEFTKVAFWHLFDNHLKQGGLYVIEDWGTGYLGNWYDGKGYEFKSSHFSRLWIKLLSRFNFLIMIPFLRKMPFRTHRYGMVGFVKQLIDEQGAGDLTRGYLSRRSKFTNILITQNMVFVRKAFNYI